MTSIVLHIVLVEIGLLFSIAIKSVNQKRFIKLIEIWEFIVFSVLATGVTLTAVPYFNYPMLVSFLIGVLLQGLWGARETILPLLISTVTKLSKETIKEVLESKKEANDNDSN